MDAVKIYDLTEEVNDMAAILQTIAVGNGDAALRRSLIYISDRLNTTAEAICTAVEEMTPTIG